MDFLSIKPPESDVFQKEPIPLALKMFFVGIGLYLFSFVLPAVEGGPHDIAAGWQCAFVAFPALAMLREDLRTCE